MFYNHLQNDTANLQRLGYLDYLASLEFLLMGMRTQSISSRAANVIGNHKSQHRSTTNVTHHVAGKFSRRRFEISDQTVNP